MIIRPELTKEWLESEYVNKKRPVRDIADGIGVSYQTISRRLKTFEIPLRSIRADLREQEFGRLIAKEMIKPGKRGRSRWHCECKCGNTTEVFANSLLTGHINSCGCLLRENNHPSEMRISKPMCGLIIPGFWNNMVNSARERNHEFTITPEYAWWLFETQNGKCAFTGLELVFARMAKYSRRGGRSSGTASLDRISSDIGYVPGNVWWVHKVVNLMKHLHSVDNFVDWCELVANNRANTIQQLTAIRAQPCGVPDTL